MLGRLFATGPSYYPTSRRLHEPRHLLRRKRADVRRARATRYAADERHDRQPKIRSEHDGRPTGDGTSRRAPPGYRVLTLRCHARTVGKVFQACGVAIPPALRPADAPAT